MNTETRTWPELDWPCYSCSSPLIAASGHGTWFCQHNSRLSDRCRGGLAHRGQLLAFRHTELDPLGRRIIEACLAGATAADYAAFATA